MSKSEKELRARLARKDAIIQALQAERDGMRVASTQLAEIAGSEINQLKAAVAWLYQKVPEQQVIARLRHPVIDQCVPAPPVKAQHVCGLTGYNGMIDPPCEGCAKP